jgi:ketosteroid isomerase-like protein
MTEESTTPDLEELTRNMIASANRGDIDAMVSPFAPDAIWRMTPLSTDFEGLARIRGFVKDWFGSYGEYAVKAEEVRNCGSGVTFAVTHQEGRLIGSPDGSLVAETWAYVFVWVDGKLVRLTSYNDIHEARAAAERLAQERG